MATWQADFYLVPRRAVAEFPAITGDIARETEWWLGTDLPADYHERMEALLPPGKSWSPDLKTWGAEDGNRIDVWRDQGRVANVLVRIDARAPDTSFLDGIAGLARDLHCMLVRADGYVTDPTLGALGKALTGSRAFRFVADPAAFLERLRIAGLEDV